MASTFTFPDGTEIVLSKVLAVGPIRVRHETPYYEDKNEHGQVLHTDVFMEVTMESGWVLIECLMSLSEMESLRSRLLGAL